MADQNTDPEIGRLSLSGARHSRVELKQAHSKFMPTPGLPTVLDDSRTGRGELMEISNIVGLRGRHQRPTPEKRQIGMDLPTFLGCFLLQHARLEVPCSNQAFHLVPSYNRNRTLLYIKSVLSVSHSHRQQCNPVLRQHRSQHRVVCAARSSSRQFAMSCVDVCVLRLATDTRRGDSGCAQHRRLATVRRRDRDADRPGGGDYWHHTSLAAPWGDHIRGAHPCRSAAV